MSEKISRRNFLRTATLGAAAAGLLAGGGGGPPAAGRCGRLVEYLAHVRRKFDEYLPRLVLDRGVRARAGRRELLVGAGGKCQECNGKNAV